MIKKVMLVLAATLLVSISSLGAEQKAAEEEINTIEFVTFTDDLDREVTVSKPKRVAALIGSYADVWQLAGGTLCASADDAWDDLELEMPEDAVNLGNTKEPSVEKLFASRPDFILASTGTRADMDMMDTLEAAGIPTAYFEISDFEDYLHMLKVCTDITGREDLYEKNGLAVQQQIEDVVAQSRERLSYGTAPTVLVLRASAASIRAKNSCGSVLSQMLLELGCINIADQEDSLLENLNIEYILKADPDYIFVVQVGDDAEGMKKMLDHLIYENPAWALLTAVKEEKVFQMDKRLYNLKPNARWAEAYAGLERILSDE